MQTGGKCVRTGDVCVRTHAGEVTESAREIYVSTHMDVSNFHEGVLKSRDIITVHVGYPDIC